MYRRLSLKNVINCNYHTSTVYLNKYSDTVILPKTKFAQKLVGKKLTQQNEHVFDVGGRYFGIYLLNCLLIFCSLVNSINFILGKEIIWKAPNLFYMMDLRMPMVLHTWDTQLIKYL